MESLEGFRVRPCPRADEIDEPAFLDGYFVPLPKSSGQDKILVPADRHGIGVAVSSASFLSNSLGIESLSAAHRWTCGQRARPRFSAVMTASVVGGGHGDWVCWGRRVPQPSFHPGAFGDHGSSATINATQVLRVCAGCD